MGVRGGHLGPELKLGPKGLEVAGEAGGHPPVHGPRPSHRG